MLGAKGEGLKSQYLVLHIQSINEPLLKAKLASMNVSPAIAPLIMTATDNAPKFVIDMGLPFAVKELEKYGVKATLTATDVPPEKGGRKKSEFIPGFVVGSGLVAMLVGVSWATWKLIFSKIFN